MLVLNRCPVESIMLDVEVSEPCPMFQTSAELKLH